MEKICEICKEKFTLEHPHQKYCGPKCKLKAGRESGKLRARIYRENHKYDYRDYMMAYMWRYRRKYPVLRERSRDGTKNNNPGSTPEISYDSNGVPNFDKELENVRNLSLRILGKTRISKSVINASR